MLSRFVVTLIFKRFEELMRIILHQACKLLHLQGIVEMGIEAIACAFVKTSLLCFALDKQKSLVILVEQLCSTVVTTCFCNLVLNT